MEGGQPFRRFPCHPFFAYRARSGPVVLLAVLPQDSAARLGVRGAEIGFTSLPWSESTMVELPVTAVDSLRSNRIITIPD